MTHVTKTIPSPVGALRLVATGSGLAAILWEDDREGRVRLPALTDAPDHPILRQAERELAEYFAGTRCTFTVPLDPAGTAFQKQVWAALRTIPFGGTRTYGDLARQLGQPNAARAVGAANGRNPLSIMVPCHRVVGSDGALTGFAGGLAAKAFLLTHERTHSSLPPASPMADAPPIPACAALDAPGPPVHDPRRNDTGPP